MSKARLYFSAPIAGTTKTSLWVTDGMVAGTVPIAVDHVGTFGLQASGFLLNGLSVWFRGVDDAGRANLYVLETTTNAVSVLGVGNASASKGLAPEWMMLFGGKVWFRGTDAAGQANLFVSDGTAAGTVEVALRTDGGAAAPRALTVAGGRLYFAADLAGGGTGVLVSTDGTAGGLRTVQSGLAPTTGLQITTMALAGSRLVFDGKNLQGQTVLWSADTSLGVPYPMALSVRGLNPTGSSSGGPMGMTAFGSRVAFTAADASLGYGVWVTDGTQSGTYELPGVSVGSFGTTMAALPGGRLAFVGSSGGKGGIWLTDGTTLGTSQLVVPGAASGGLAPGLVLGFGGSLVFDGLGSDGQRHIWLSDGTSAGTQAIETGVGLAYFTGQNGAFIPALNDDFVDRPGNQSWVGTGPYNTLTIDETRRGDTFTLLADGTLQVGHGGDVDRVSGVQQIRFIDGRVVLDPNDAAASVTRLYQAALGRAPDEDGLVYWTGRVQAGTPLSALAGGFLGSAEFVQRYGAGLDNRTFVSRVYQNALGRAPDGSGLDFYTGYLNSGRLSRADVLATIADSAENRAGTAGLVAQGIWLPSAVAAQVARLYDTALGRLPDAAGLAYWTPAIEQGRATLRALADVFVSSTEFLARYGALDNAGFVAAVYGNTLHRTPDAAGAAFWTAGLARGAARADVVIGFSESAEHQALTADAIWSADPSRYGIKVS